MDNKKSSLVWDESNADLVPSFFATMGSRVRRVEGGKDC